MTKTRIVIASIGGFVGLILVAFVLELTGLGFFKFFEPKRENIRREIWENTKSRVQGVIQDLAKHKKEWGAATSKDRTAIEALIRMQYADFDETKIDAAGLRQWLIKVRGY